MRDLLDRDKLLNTVSSMRVRQCCGEIAVDVASMSLLVPCLSRLTFVETAAGRETNLYLICKRECGEQMITRTGVREREDECGGE